jgi:hypothetical protein
MPVTVLTSERENAEKRGLMEQSEGQKKEWKNGRNHWAISSEKEHCSLASERR